MKPADPINDMTILRQERLRHHLGINSWIVVMSLRLEAFRLDFCHIKFWRGCFWF